jgi:large subunit ribosomal protein L13
VASTAPPAAETPPVPPPAKTLSTPVPTPPAPQRPPVTALTVVDASGLVLGRAASVIAKRLLTGESIVVVNAEQSVVTGDRAMVLETYRANRARGSKRTGPHFPRYPDRIFRRTVRGMLPHLKARGKEAFDRLQVHIGIPPEFQGRTRQTLEVAQARPALRRPLTLAEISRLLGARV